VVSLILIVFCRFSWAQLPCQHLWIKVPRDSTAFLYSISK
jgi:hypothetical protein